MIFIKMEYRRTTLHPYDNDYYDDRVETNSWAYPEERQSPFYVLLDEIKKLIYRCLDKEYKSRDVRT